ncbi:MAG: metal-sulfur cluster assembly factor [Burkholderiaceae bacterium]|nr:metal-sulfur cluster assembly factor [Burkholderiaceae bacterium]
MTSEAFSTPIALDETSIQQLLSQIIDPEVGASITDMGLVYGIRVSPELVEIDITMTSPACPMGGMILDDIDATLERYLPSDVQRKVNVVWDPPWDPSRMSATLRARFHLDS